MPSRSAARITVTPSSNSPVWPSIVTFGMGSMTGGGCPRALSLGSERAATELDVLDELVAELGDERLGRHGGGVGEHAHGVPHHVVGDVEQQLEILLAARAF